MTLAQVEEHLRWVDRRPTDPLPETIDEALATLKREARDRYDEPGAKLVWCLEQARAAQNSYLRAFDRMKRGEFYQAWCGPSWCSI